MTSFSLKSANFFLPPPFNPQFKNVSLELHSSVNKRLIVLAKCFRLRPRPIRKGAGCLGSYKKLVGRDVCRRPTDVGSRRLRPTSPRRLLEFTVLRRHDVGARRRRDQCMTSSRRHDVEFFGVGL